MSKSSTTMPDAEDLLNPTPGDVLLQDFLRPMGLSQNTLARAIRMPPRRINEIVLGKRAVSADTDLRLARYFGISEGLFLGLQADFDLMERRRQIGAILDSIEPHAEERGEEWLRCSTRGRAFTANREALTNQQSHLAPLDGPSGHLPPRGGKGPPCEEKTP